MREILFRGKIKTDNEPYKEGQWVYGDYVRLVDGERTIPHIYGCGEVIPETVGQYTGLTDKYGNKIFEGDIIEFDEEYGEIIYSQNEAMFIVVFDTWCTDFDHLNEKCIEVIGNVSDNTELLGGEKNGRS